MKSILIKDTTREERLRIVHQALWGACGVDCEFCSGCDNRGGGRIESISPVCGGGGLISRWQITGTKKSLTEVWLFAILIAQK